MRRPSVEIPKRTGAWRERSHCKGLTYFFFPVVSRYRPDGSVVIDRYKTNQNTEHAKAICRECPVREECLLWAIVYLPQGVAGGLTARERRKLRKRLHLPDPVDDLDEVADEAV